VKPNELASLLLVVGDAAEESGHEWLAELMRKLAKRVSVEVFAEVAHGLEKKEYNELVAGIAERVVKEEAERMRNLSTAPPWPEPHLPSLEDAIEEAIEPLFDEPRRLAGLDEHLHILANTERADDGMYGRIRHEAIAALRHDVRHSVWRAIERGGRRR